MRDRVRVRALPSPSRSNRLRRAAWARTILPWHPGRAAVWRQWRRRTVRATEVRHEHHGLGALLEAVVDRGHGAVDARRVGDHRRVVLVLRHVEVDTNEDTLASDVQAREGDLVHLGRAISLSRLRCRRRWRRRLAGGTCRISSRLGRLHHAVFGRIGGIGRCWCGGTATLCAVGMGVS